MSPYYRLLLTTYTTQVIAWRRPEEWDPNARLFPKDWEVAGVVASAMPNLWLLAACNRYYYWPMRGEAARRPTSAAAGSVHVLAARDTTMHSQRDSGEASEQLTRLRRMVECDICFERYSSETSRTARNLACGHSFCCGCLASLLAPLAGSGDHKLLPCPACRAVTKVPMGRPENLSCNWAVTA